MPSLFGNGKAFRFHGFGLTLSSRFWFCEILPFADAQPSVYLFIVKFPDTSDDSFDEHQLVANPPARAETNIRTLHRMDLEEGCILPNLLRRLGFQEEWILKLSDCEPGTDRRETKGRDVTRCTEHRVQPGCMMQQCPTFQHQQHSSCLSHQCGLAMTAHTGSFETMQKHSRIV